MRDMEQIKEDEMFKFGTREQKGKPVEDTGVETRGDAETEVQRAQFQQLDASQANTNSNREKKLDMLMGISLPISIELGRANMEIRNILDLNRGSIIEFDKIASEPVDIVINGKKMAEGEVVVIDKHFAIRVTSLVEASERIKGLGK